MTHKFKIGEIVFLRPSVDQSSAGGAYIILQRLPQYYGEFEYRVRNSYELHERVVRENELRKVSKLSAGAHFEYLASAFDVGCCSIHVTDFGRFGGVAGLLPHSCRRVSRLVDVSQRDQQQ